MKVLITRKLPGDAVDKLKKRYDVEINESGKRLSKDDILEKVKGKDALLCLLTDIIDEEVIEAGEDLKVISNYAVGYDNIDVEAATSRGIPVTNTPGILTDATADLAWGLILATARKIAKGDKFVREDRFEGWDPTLMVGSEVHGKTLGIIGMGKIGSAVAKRSLGFDMDILYYNRSRKMEIEKELGAEKVELDTLLKQSDIVSLHVPLTEETEDMISWQEFKMMKKTAFLINTARGEVVNEEALIEALRSEKIAGAGIDVYSDEPYGANPDYYTLSNVVLTPHLGSASHRARNGMAKMAVDNIIGILESGESDYVVNPDVL
ncbi:MAG: 2-hydroxyacid dehydrogenase [Candidatus Saliniplasma sp.]